MSDTNRISLLVLLGPPNAFEDFGRLNSLDRRFFIHCTSRDQCTNALESHATTVCRMDIFLPDTAVDLIRIYNDLACPRKWFHVYCTTEELVTKYKRLRTLPNCHQVFNANRLQEKLERRASIHLLFCIEALEEGDEDAADLLVPIGDIFEENATKINEEIRKKACLGDQPAEHEEE